MRGRKWGIVISYISTAITMITGLYLSSFYIRVLGDTEYGVFQSIASFASYLVLLEFGAGSVITRNLSICYSNGADEETIEKNISTIWSITCLLAVLIAFVSFLFYGALDAIYSRSMTADQIAYGKQILIVVTVNLILSFFQQTISGIALAKENYTFTAKLNIVKTVLKTVLLTCILLKYKYAILIAIVDAALSLGVGIYSFVFCKTQYKVSFSLKKFSWDVCRESLPLSVAIFFQAIVNQANSNVDKFVIGIKLNPESVSLYGIALFIYSVFSQLTTIPITMYAPKTIRHVASGLEGKPLVDTLIYPSRLIMLLGGCILFGFVSVGRQFITIMYGKEYIQAWIIAIIIMAPMLINMANGCLINVLDAKNKRMVRSGVLLVTTLANIVLTVLWIDEYGMIGAAAATAICTLIGQISLMNVYYSKKMQLPILYMYKEVFRGILPLQIIGMIAAMLVCTLFSNVYLSFLMGGIVFAGVVAVGCYHMGFLKELKNRD